MAKQTIEIGSGPNTKTGDDARTSAQKSNSNFTELYNHNTNNPVQVIKPGTFAVIKHPNNSDVNNLEVGDMVSGWWSSVEFWANAQFIGGSIASKTSYKIITPIEDL